MALRRNAGVLPQSVVGKPGEKHNPLLKLPFQSSLNPLGYKTSSIDLFFFILKTTQILHFCVHFSWRSRKELII